MMARIVIKVKKGTTLEMVEDLIQELKKRRIDPSYARVRWDGNVAHVRLVPVKPKPRKK